MSLSENGNGNGMIMPVQPLYGNGGYGNSGWGYPVAMPVYGGYGGGFGDGFGGDWLALFLIAAMFGGFGGGFGGWGMGGFGGDWSFPWLMSGQAGINANTNAGFDNAAVSSQLSSIQTSLNTGFSNAEVANCNRAMDAMQTAYTNQIADLNRSFDAQTAIDNHLDSLDMTLQKCCCDNQLATESLRYTVATENAADRAELSNGIRDIITAQNAGTQRILDQLCNDKIDAKNERIAELQTQVNMQNLAASQAAQTAAIVADNNAQSQLLIQRIAPYPVPAYPVSNPYGCNGFNNGYCYGFNNFGFNPFGNVGFGNGSF